MTSLIGGEDIKDSDSLEVSLSTMWAKDRFARMADFVAKARELGFTHIEVNASVSRQKLSELIANAAPISSLHSPCPAALSSRGTPVAELSLSALDEGERAEAVSAARQTIDLAASVKARAIVLHMGEVPVDPGLQVRMHELYSEGHAKSEEYTRARKELVSQRKSRVAPYLDAARKSLLELSDYSSRKGIMLGIETRYHLHEIPNMEETADLLSEAPADTVGYWHDMGHAEVQQRLGFGTHEEWLSRFNHRMIGIHLHDIRGLSDHHAPGNGDTDWTMVKRYLTARTLKICEIGQWNDEDQVQRVVGFLRKEGITG